jgi:heme oxygenase
MPVFMPASAETSELSLRHRLRDATAEAHQRVDSGFGALNLQRRADYRRFLEASASALLPLERALVDAGVARIFPDWPERSRCDAILADLADLGGTPDPLPSPAPLDFAGVLGTMYVLEGSRLGASFLIKSVSRSPDPAVAEATAYLGHGEGRRLWPTFLAQLEVHATSLRDEAGALDAARQAFDWFERAAARTQRTGALA